MLQVLSGCYRVLLEEGRLEVGIYIIVPDLVFMIYFGHGFGIWGSWVMGKSVIIRNVFEYIC